MAASRQQPRTERASPEHTKPAYLAQRLVINELRKDRSYLILYRPRANIPKQRAQRGRVVATGPLPPFSRPAQFSPALGAL